MNNKLRNNSIFAQLTNEQTEMLEDWLFEDKLGYQDVLEKMQKEFAVQTSKSALSRFYRRLALQRSEERRVETVALCLEGLAAKNDGTLQAGLLALANQCAIELLVEQPKSIREFATLLRALTSAGVFEMKHIEFHETRERKRQREIEEKEKEAKRKEEHARWSAEYHARYEAREAKRKATIEAKKAAIEAAEKGVANAAMTNVQTPRTQTNEPVGQCPIPNAQGQMEKLDEQPEAETPNAGGASVPASRPETGQSEAAAGKGPTSND